MTKPERQRVLLVEDDEDDALITRELLDASELVRFEVEWVRGPEEGIERLAANEHAVCLLDYRLGAANGLDVLRSARERGSEVPVVMLTGAKGSDVDLAAMQAGASEYLVKGSIDTELLARTIRYSVAHAAAKRELRAKNAALAALDQQKNLLLGMAAHDLRNPLGVIMGYAGFLAATWESLPPSEVTDVLERIRGSSHYMLELIDDLLDLSAIEHGTLLLETTLTDVAALVQRSVGAQSVIAQSKAIRVGADLPAMPLMHVDARRMSQVVDNLVSNAVKYSRPGTTVNVRAWPREDGGCVIEVRDEGIGIAKENLGRIFEPFEKVVSRGTSGEKSTGLGLCIARRIVEAHAGHIEVESELGVGSTFRVVLPGRVGLPDSAPRAGGPA